MVRIEAVDDELHRCLVSPATESAASCVLSTEDDPGQCELLGAAGTWTARVSSALCGIVQPAFWRDVLKLANAPKRDLIERAMMREELMRKAELKDLRGASQVDQEAEGAPATFWTAPWRSLIPHDGTKASRDGPSSSLHSGYLVDGARENKPMPASSVTSCQLVAGLAVVAFFGCVVVLLLVHHTMQGRRSERERHARSSLLRSAEAASSEEFVCSNIAQ